MATRSTTTTAANGTSSTSHISQNLNTGVTQRNFNATASNKLYERSSTTTPERTTQSAMTTSLGNGMTRATTQTADGQGNSFKGSSASLPDGRRSTSQVFTHANGTQTARYTATVGNTKYERTSNTTPESRVVTSTTTTTFSNNNN
jgi:hypothetical protein